MHKNNGCCEACAEKMNKFPGFNEDLRAWFMKIQSSIPEFHCADAGRGRVDQETYFNRGASKAHYGQSSHNYNCAIDGFFLIDDKYNCDKENFLKVVPLLESNIVWYGDPTAKFHELPHFEIAGWRALRDSGAVKLVED